jgi:hypothetical protein
MSVGKTPGDPKMSIFNSLFSASACIFFVFSVFVDLDPRCCAWEKKKKNARAPLASPLPPHGIRVHFEAPGEYSTSKSLSV